MIVTNLIINPKVSQPSTRFEEYIDVTEQGITGGSHRNKLRHILIIPMRTLEGFSLIPGQLGENITVDGLYNIHDLPSGTVIKIGTAKIRLTFHCEPCKKIKGVVSIRKILHKRGYLGQVIQPGRISIGNKITIEEEKYEEIPYALADRIKWYLDSIGGKVSVVDLVEAIGLSKSYCRAIPSIIKNRVDIDKHLITYRKKI